MFKLLLICPTSSLEKIVILSQQQADGADLFYVQPLCNLSGARIIQQDRASIHGLRQGDGFGLSGVHKDVERFDQLGIGRLDGKPCDLTYFIYAGMALASHGDFIPNFRRHRNLGKLTGQQLKLIDAGQTNQRSAIGNGCDIAHFAARLGSGRHRGLSPVCPCGRPHP